MTIAAYRKPFRIALLAASYLVAAPAAAQEASVEERLDRLEAMVSALLERMDQDKGAMESSQAENTAQVQQALNETRALQQRQAELAAQIAEPKKQEDKGFRVGNTTVSYAGYVKLDAIAQRFSGGDVESGSIVRDFLIPGAIPIGGESSGFDTDFSARQTRFIFKTATDVGAEHTLNSQIELDFMVTGGGNERVSNSYEPRLRQAFISYDNWLFGQTWSTFQNVGSLPESLDFIGTTPGTVFDRQPMIRYTNGGLQIAVEQPETEVTSPTGGRVLSGDDNMPDIVARYNFSGDWGGLAAAGIVRNLRITDDDFGTGSDSALGYGLSLSGKLKVGPRDDLRFMATAGDGIGRYIGLNIVNDAALDAAGNLDPIFTYSGFAAYRHFWSDKVRSTVAGSYFKADNPILLTTDQVTDESWNALANIIYSPVPPLSIGLEYMYAERTLEDGRSGNMRKIQVSTKYSF
ncbi:DcaP family trimeric outer membrane transporter [Altererythrobacter ishigakiensis]|uniref:Porin-like protein n=1 Tax=Altererythrobacter ishigakiensis TaxID=476157 RepID=A0A562UMP3_9SPHN|nr:DcaP family trimeric outer membrane transporter [Altererythrobacter ishigakiensis]TWJ06880.1 porin-like protein [Altererythrobacter ishigakiensis]